MMGQPIDGELKEYDKESIEWAVDYVRAHLNISYPIEIEQELVLLDDKYNIVTFGTADLVNGMRLFDLKSGDYHNYYLQMAIYGLAQMDRIGVDDLMVAVLFCRFRKAHELFLKRDEVKGRIFSVVNQVLDPEKKPRANPYCRWCKKIMSCSAVKDVMAAIEPEHYEIADPKELSRALFRARLLKEWAEQIETFAKQLALTGIEIPGYYLKSRAGKREIMDVKRAYELSTLPPDIFIALCHLSIGALEDAIVREKKISKTSAKKFVNTQLAEVIQRRAPTLSLSPNDNSSELTEK
jgi:hypothetical protein